MIETSVNLVAPVLTCKKMKKKKREKKNLIIILFQMKRVFILWISKRLLYGILRKRFDEKSMYEEVVGTMLTPYAMPPSVQWFAWISFFFVLFERNENRYHQFQCWHVNVWTAAIRTQNTELCDRDSRWWTKSKCHSVSVLINNGLILGTKN